MDVFVSMSSSSVAVRVTGAFFFSSRRRHTSWTGDWSSDVCSSDLSCWTPPPRPGLLRSAGGRQPRPGTPRARRAHLRAPPRPQGRRVFKTAIDRHTSGATINVSYKHSRAKQYLKDGRALRIETVINDADDLGLKRLLPNLDHLQAKARAINQRLLDTQAGRPGHGPCESSLCADRTVHRHRHHQQAPARLDDRTARHPLQHEPGQLRPCPAAPQQPDHPRPRPQPLHPDSHRHRVRDLLHQGPRPDPQTAARHPNPAPTYAPTTKQSASASPTPGCARHPDLTRPISETSTRIRLMTIVGIALPKDR